jgi:hypothetical protein
LLEDIRPLLSLDVESSSWFFFLRCDPWPFDSSTVGYDTIVGRLIGLCIISLSSEGSCFPACSILTADAFGNSLTSERFSFMATVTGDDVYEKIVLVAKKRLELLFQI